MEVESIRRPRNDGEAMALLDRFAQELTDYRSINFIGGIFTIGASHTGDMYDVATAHTIIGHSLVIIWGVEPATAGKAAEIARFIDERETVMWTRSGPPPGDYYTTTAPSDLRALAAGAGDSRPYWIKEGGATTIVTAYAGAAADRRQDIPGFVAPEVYLKGTGTSLDKDILEDLTAHGFTGGKAYVIVNYRAAGHSGAGTAPALDTGEDGFLQLMSSVRELGLVPVPMGEFDPYPRLGITSKPEQGANLLKYWTWRSVDTYGRRAESRLLRVLAERFRPVAAVGMRSGVTDLLAYVGIPTLSIDIHPLRGVLSKGWQRPLKRESVFPYYKIVSLMQERKRETDRQPGWPGTIAKDDLAAIKDALGRLAHGGGPTGRHPQATGGVGDTAASLLHEVTTRVEALRRAADYRPPTASEPASTSSGGSRSHTRNMEELKRQLEQEKGLGVGAGQVAEHEIWLRNQREFIDHLIDWLTDAFITQTAEVRDAIANLKEARRLL